MTKTISGGCCLELAEPTGLTAVKEMVAVAGEGGGIVVCSRSNCPGKCRRGSRRFFKKTPGAGEPAGTLRKIALVGTPNVGKSVIFNALTGAYVAVSNYPGTTVEVSRGRARLAGDSWEVVDTPGMYSLMPITEEERVSRRLLLEEHPDLVLHVVDAKNLGRMLSLTLQLMEAGLPVILVVNLFDEAERLGIKVDTGKLAELLGIPVVATAAAYGRGLEDLRQAITGYRQRSLPAARVVDYGPDIEDGLSRWEVKLTGAYRLAKRAVVLLLLQGDEEIASLVRRNEVDAPGLFQEMPAAEDAWRMACLIGEKRRLTADGIAGQVMDLEEPERFRWGEWLDRLVCRPVTGIPVLLLVIYFGLYKFVGVFGAGTLVNLIEHWFFTGIDPWVNHQVRGLIPWVSLQNLLAGDYGIFTLALRYAIAIVLPIVGTFFLFFSVIEDSGYLPRLAMLVDRLFKTVGLSGRAVIPMTLGFGCDTMATMVTRTLETPRERLIATLLLALAIPCSAQLGVILAILSGRPGALAIWAGFILLVFILVGYLSARVLPGSATGFYMELPPLRWPNWRNVLVKTYTRMHWYFLEVLPLFVLASFLIWLGYLTGIFGLLLHQLAVAVGWLGLPPEAAQVFLFGFFRRDYGAAGLFDLYHSGLLSGNQLVVAAATLTLFVPCLAQFIMMIKERGAKTAVALGLFIFPFAFLAGYLLNRLLTGLGVVL